MLLISKPTRILANHNRRWIRARSSFFLPVKILSRIFRGKFRADLKHLYRSKAPLAPAHRPCWPIPNSLFN